MECNRRRQISGRKEWDINIDLEVSKKRLEVMPVRTSWDPVESLYIMFGERGIVEAILSYMTRADLAVEFHMMGYEGEVVDLADQEVENHDLWELVPDGDMLPGKEWGDVRRDFHEFPRGTSVDYVDQGGLRGTLQDLGSGIWRGPQAWSAPCYMENCSLPLCLAEAFVTAQEKKMAEKYGVNQLHKSYALVVKTAFCQMVKIAQEAEEADRFQVALAEAVLDNGSYVLTRYLELWAEICGDEVGPVRFLTVDGLGEDEHWVRWFNKELGDEYNPKRTDIVHFTGTEHCLRIWDVHDDPTYFRGGDRPLDMGLAVANLPQISVGTANVRDRQGDRGIGRNWFAGSSQVSMHGVREDHTLAPVMGELDSYYPREGIETLWWDVHDMVAKEEAGVMEEFILPGKLKNRLKRSWRSEC